MLEKHRHAHTLQQSYETDANVNKSAHKTEHLKHDTLFDDISDGTCSGQLCRR